jgi:flagellar biogenesis protein FliO
VVFTLGEMVFLCLFICTLVWFAVRYQHGKSVPDWVPDMVVPAT